MIETSSPVYQALCRVLVGQKAMVAWSEFSPVDWQQLASVAQAERVAPLLCHSFRREGWPIEMPDAVRQFLLKEFYQATANGSLMFRELEQVLARLGTQGIKAVLLKGAALGLTVYPDISLRPLGDLDILIRPSDLKTAVGVVEASGYAPENPPLRRGLEYLFFYETNFRGGNWALTHLELHWDLVGGEGSRYRPDTDWFWAQARSIQVGSTPALVLSPTAHFLHAAVHVTLKHGADDARLLWLYDLHLLITRCQDLDWNLLLSKAREFHWAPAVAAALQKLYQLFATPLPAGVLEALGGADDPEAKDLVTRMASREHSRTSGALRHLAFLGWSSRLYWLAAVVFPDRDYMRWRYKPAHAWQLPLYYLARWSDMTLDGLITLVKRTRVAFTAARHRSTEAN